MRRDHARARHNATLCLSALLARLLAAHVREIFLQYTTIKARGFEFEALTDGPEDGELVLLLHGLPRNCWEWHHQIPAIASSHVIAPDLRGFCAGARPSETQAYHTGIRR